MLISYKFAYSAIREPTIKVLEVFLKHTHTPTYTHEEINLLIKK
jgi:hypothetical protein